MLFNNKSLFQNELHSTLNDLIGNLSLKVHLKKMSNIIKDSMTSPLEVSFSSFLVLVSHKQNHNSTKDSQFWFYLKFKKYLGAFLTLGAFKGTRHPHSYHPEKITWFHLANKCHISHLTLLTMI